MKMLPFYICVYGVFYYYFNIVNTRTEGISITYLLPVTPIGSYYLEQCPWTILELKKKKYPQDHKPSA